MTDQDTIID